MMVDFLGAAAAAVSLLGPALWFVLYKRTKPAKHDDADMGYLPADLLQKWLPLLEQLRIPPFDLVSILKSTGAQGVFRIRDSLTDDYLALKVYHFSADPTTTMAAQREIFALSWLAGIASPRHVFLTQSDDRDVFAVGMQWIPGESLQAYLANRLRDSGEHLSFVEVDRLLGGLFAAVRSIHEVGIIHCDIKPSNLVADWDSVLAGSREVSLIDFGMAEASARDKTATSSFEGVSGTPVFTAPERLFFSASSPAADVYSCGVVAVYAMSGWGREALARVHGPLAVALGRALNSDPFARYSSIDDFESAWRQAFALHLKQQPSVTRFPGPVRAMGQSEEWGRTIIRPWDTLVQSTQEAPAIQTVLWIKEADPRGFARMTSGMRPLANSVQEAAASGYLDWVLRTMEDALLGDAPLSIEDEIIQTSYDNSALRDAASILRWIDREQRIPEPLRGAQGAE